MGIKDRIDRLEDHAPKQRRVEDMTDAELLAILGLPPDCSDEELLRVIAENRAAREGKAL